MAVESLSTNTAKHPRDDIGVRDEVCLRGGAHPWDDPAEPPSVGPCEKPTGSEGTPVGSPDGGPY